MFYGGRVRVSALNDRGQVSRVAVVDVVGRSLPLGWVDWEGDKGTIAYRSIARWPTTKFPVGRAVVARPCRGDSRPVSSPCARPSTRWGYGGLRLVKERMGGLWRNGGERMRSLWIVMRIEPPTKLLARHGRSRVRGQIFLTHSTGSGSGGHG